MTYSAVLTAAMGAIEETVKETAGPFGVPGGVLYAALMQHGCSLSTYEMVMDALVREGKVVRRGQCYFPPEGLKKIG